MAHKIIIGLFFFISIFNSAVSAEEQKRSFMTVKDLPSFGNPPADKRFAYGDDQFQFADLRVPKGPGPHPVIILIHGGCWLSQYDIVHAGKLAKGFADNGIATWSLEYRRVGNEGGGWPGTFQDIANGADHLLKVAKENALDISRVIVSGHSAGGHLALWLTARKDFKNNSIFSSSNKVQLKGVLALAPVPDLALAHKKGVCGNVIDKLMHGSPSEQPERYAMASIPELLPIGLPQILVIGRFDKNWFDAGNHYYQKALAANDKVSMIDATESAHFEMIDPDSSTWPMVLKAARELLEIKL
jgi:acetyl esterase/lipase